jgi:putative SOS response-associated peptidase YedK
MCGRYVLGRVTDLSERFQLRQIPMPLDPTFNAAPTQRLPVIVIEPDGERRIVAMKWGLEPNWRRSDHSRAPEPINARAETLTERPMFRGLIAQNRCLVPATGFYEWQKTPHGKQPFFVHPTDQDIFAFAGLWSARPADGGSPSYSFTIITTTPNELVACLHDRMAAILEPAAEDEWLDPDVSDAGVIERVIHPYPADRMEIYPVSRAVNNTRVNTEELIKPIGEPITGNEPL